MNGFESSTSPAGLNYAAGLVGGVQHAPLATIAARLEELRAIKVRRRVFAVSLVASDAIACFAGATFGQLAAGRSVDVETSLTVLLTVFPIYFLAALQTGAHNPAISRRPSDSIKAGVMALAMTAAIFFFALFATKVGATFSRLLVGQTLLFTFILGAAGRYAVAKRSKQKIGAQPFADICIYDDVPLGPKAGRGAMTAADLGIDVVPLRPETVARLGDIARGMDRIVVHCSAERREAWSHALRCVDRRSEIVMPELNQLMPLDVRYRSGAVSLVLANGPLRWNQRLIKFIFDRGVSALALLAMLPLFGVIAVAIKLESRGDVFFRQERIGLGNRRFRILKFRSMRTEKADPEGRVSTGHDDDRVTRVGDFLRRTSLDELPQLINVLLGQMSIVGPRPHAAASRAEETLFWDIDHRYWQRHSIKPGITGLAQIRGLRGTTHARQDLQDRLYADLEYVAQWSLANDIRIIFQTFAVMRHRNAY